MHLPSGKPASGFRRLGGACARFFTGAGLPVFLLTVTVLYEAFLLAVLFAPAGSGPWSRFAVDFKVWCFSYDPRTGGMAWALVWIMLLEPVFITGLVLLVWRRGLGALLTLQGWWRQRGAVFAAGAVAAAAFGGLYIYGLADASEADLPPFPGERIRTALEPPAFELTDQAGQTVRLADLRGRVVLVTGIYALCSLSCPEILLELRNLLDGLPPEAREHLSILALSLNPEYDSPLLRARIVSAYNFTHPEFRYLNDEPEAMREILARLQFAHLFNPRTGVIDHANLFILIDADGRIAYRFTLNARTGHWLREAVLQLTAEASGTLPGFETALRGEP
ncbi:MAG: SCO family protein [Puniceicoccaceae bacterium]|nr:MAG: SCO family protein [Puniceicoccaceae bacterium]